MIKGTVITTTDYSGNYIYRNNQMINQSEGYLEPNGQGSYDYGYRLKVGGQRVCIPSIREKSRLCRNHLGNIRITFVDFDHNGSIALSEITEENNYYPFGLKHKGYNDDYSSNRNAVANKFKYNGKELNDELGLDLYDYGARFYDAALGRWHVVDPLAEKCQYETPFAYVGNNPLSFIDPDGRKKWSFNLSINVSQGALSLGAEFFGVSSVPFGAKTIELKLSASIDTESGNATVGLEGTYKETKAGAFSLGTGGGGATSETKTASASIEGGINYNSKELVGSATATPKDKKFKTEESGTVGILTVSEKKGEGKVITIGIKEAKIEVLVIGVGGAAYFKVEDSKKDNHIVEL